MILLRKTDYYIQLLLELLILILVPLLHWYGFLTGLFILGCWQLLSASFNSSSLVSAGFRKGVAIYWKWTVVVLASLFLSIPLSWLLHPDHLRVFVFLVIGASIPVAVYYLVIYKKLINHYEMRRELSGIIK